MRYIAWASASLAIPVLVAAHATTPAKRDAPLQPPVLECLEVTYPLRSPYGYVDGDEIIAPNPGGSEPPSCKVTLMEYVFGNSYGHPFVGEFMSAYTTLHPHFVPLNSRHIGKYKPPPCEFNRVIMNFTVVSQGRQFDRLATMWLGDTEVWRTSTAEPKPQPGIAWTFWKDMTAFNALWKKEQTVIFDLGNLINDMYTGSFNTTLTATFFNDEDLLGPDSPPADVVVPISARMSSSGESSAFTFPAQDAVNAITLPRNIQRAVVSLAATGQADEEFWWTNVPDSAVNIFNGTTLLGKSSFREVQLLIDDHVAGLSWPYPVVFTGGISPPLHRPLVGIQAFSLREQEIDITPWLGYLCDGKSHNFTIQVRTAYDDVPNSYWLLSGKIFLWLDKPGSVTKGCLPKVSVSKLNFNPNEASLPNNYLKYRQTIDRNIEVKSKIRRNGETLLTNWTQDFSMDNAGNVTNGGNDQQVTSVYQGSDRAVQDLYTYYYAAYRYPVDTSIVTKQPDGEYSLTLNASLTQGMDLSIGGKSAYPSGLNAFLPLLRDRVAGTGISTTRTGQAFFYQKDGGKTSGGYGSSQQTYKFGARGLREPVTPDFKTELMLYSRDIAVTNETITKDEEWLFGAEVPERGAEPTAKAVNASFAPAKFPAQLAQGKGVGQLGPPLWRTQRAL